MIIITITIIYCRYTVLIDVYCINRITNKKYLKISTNLKIKLLTLEDVLLNL